MTGGLRALLLLSAPALVAVTAYPTQVEINRWSGLTAAAVEIRARRPPPAARLPGLQAALDEAASPPPRPALAEALTGTIALLNLDPTTADAAFTRYSARPGPIPSSMARYLAGPAAADAPPGSDQLARSIEAWRRAYRTDPKSLQELLAEIPEKQRGFHLQMAALIAHVRGAPRDLETAEKLLRPLSRSVSQPWTARHLGFAPDAFDPIITADPDGSLVVRKAPWRGLLVPTRSSLRLRRVDVQLALASLYSAQGKHNRALFQAEILDKTSTAAIEAKGQRRALDELLYPRPYRGQIGKLAREQKLDPFLIYAVAREESKFDPQAGSPVGAQGLMQVMPKTADWILQLQGKDTRLSKAALQVPHTNLGLGAWYLRHLADKFVNKDTRWKWTLAAYNAGLGNAERWLKIWKQKRWKQKDIQPEDVIDFRETRNYLIRVTASQARYQELYGTDEG